MASRRIRKKQEKLKLMEAYEANKVQFKNLVDMANEYKEQGIDAEEVFGLELSAALPKNPTMEWLKSNPFFTGNHAYFQQKMEEFKKDLRQERLKRTFFGDYYDNYDKNKIIRRLTDMGLIKTKNWAYEDVLYDVAARYTKEEIDDIIHGYVSRVDRVRELEKRSDYREKGSFVVFDDD